MLLSFRSLKKYFVEVLYQICLCRDFLPVCVACLLVLLMSFRRARVFSFSQVQLISFFFLGSCFHIISKMSLPYPGSSRFPPVLSSGGFIILCIIFRFVIHFDLIFCEGFKVCVESFFFFACGCLIVLAPFVEKTLIFSPFYGLCPFVKVKLTVFMGVYFWAVCSVPLACLCMLSPGPHCPGYYSCIVGLKGGLCQSSNLVLLQYCVACSGPLSLHVNSTSDFSIFPKFSCSDFNWDYIESIDQVGKNWHLGNIVFLPINMKHLSIYLVFWFLSSGFCSFPYIDPVHVLLDLYLVISFWGRYKW